MNVEQILSYVRQKGIILIPEGNQIKYKAPSGIMTPDLAETIKMHKQAILGILTQNRETIRETTETLNQSDKLEPGDCAHCPAAGYWDWNGPGKWCFHTAYFLGRSGKPTPCKTAKHGCPLTRKEL